MNLKENLNSNSLVGNELNRLMDVGGKEGRSGLEKRQQKARCQNSQTLLPSQHIFTASAQTVYMGLPHIHTHTHTMRNT